MLSIEVPDEYGYVLLTCGALPAVTNFIMAGAVMKARKKYNVKYPNLYATPGFHEKADEFNRVQRGHQHMFETLSDFRINSLIAGLKYPIVVTVCGVAYSFGCYLYLAGYSDNNKSVKLARHTKGGPIHFLANMVVMGLSGYTAVTMCGII